MKLLNRIFVALLSAGSLLAAVASPAEDLRADGSELPADGSQAKNEIVKDVYTPWSLVGDWRVTHPLWTDVVSFHADGTVLTQRQGTTGHWILTADRGTPLVVIRWDRFGTESVAMITANHFRGQSNRGKMIDMRRGDETAEGKTPESSRAQ